MREIGPIKVLVVDDSPLVRSIFDRVLSSQEDIEVVGGAKDPFEARELIIAHRPNVIILDIEMPRMDGITFLEKLQEHYPVPVIMCSGITEAGGKLALRSLEIGAFDFVAKPTTGGTKAMRSLGEDLAEKVRAAAMAMPVRPFIPPTAVVTPQSFRNTGINPDKYLIAIGASTGGTEAITQLLRCVPADFPSVAVVQHMPAGFTKSFADRLNELSRLEVKEAEDGDRLASGKAFIARGGIQMGIQSIGGEKRIRYGSTELVNRHCPSVDVLFNSVASTCGPSAIGIQLTGMGDDGAKGLLNILQSGGLTIGQNKRSCVVYGMPKVAAEIGAVQHTGEPSAIPGIIFRILSKRNTRTSKTLT